MRSTGFWNDEYCVEDQHGYMCAATQYYKNCVGKQVFTIKLRPLIFYNSDIAEVDREACGAGLSERECDELKCCFDPRSTIQCYRPQVTTFSRSIRNHCLGKIFKRQHDCRKSCWNYGRRVLSPYCTISSLLYVFEPIKYHYTYSLPIKSQYCQGL